MTENPFDQPTAPGGGIQWEDHHGALLVVEPIAFEAQVSTALGAKDAVRADIYVIDGKGSPAEYKDCLIFPRLLLAQTRRSLGHKILGRLTQGVAKTGQNAPWVLGDASASDQQIAQQWLTNRDRQTFSAPQSEPPF